MTAKLDKPLKRELNIGAKPFVLTISPEGLKLVPKGKRKGHELNWAAFVSGEAALAVALNASLERSVPAESNTTATSKKRRMVRGKRSAASKT
jgi:hypothetical protein